MDDLTPQQNLEIRMAENHGRNTTNRTAEELLTVIGEMINKQTVEYNGKLVKLKTLTEKPSVGKNGEVALMFDALNPDNTFDHIEFTITKTGWGRSM